jgi:hypothetical protein
MARRRLGPPVIATALIGLAGCSLAVDVSDIDRGCGSGRKLCGSGHCVAIDDPAYGCTPDHCEPCELTNAIPTCVGQSCVVSACWFGFDCPNEAGCPENILVEVDNCGACGLACAAGQSCRDGHCQSN